jgi:hypothetical protein
MPWGAAIGAAGAIGGGLLGSMGAQSQVKAMKEAIQLDRERYEDSKKNLGPYVNFGKNQLNNLSRFISTKNPMDFKDPGYDFRFEQGRKGLEGSAAASGMLQSGDTLRGLVKYGQDMGSSEYGNAFNRYLSEGNFLQNLAGMGQNAATGLGYLGAQSSANIANATSNAGFGDAERVWADVAGGVGGMAGNAFKKYLNAQKSPKSSVGGPSIFSNSPADDVMMA